MRLLLVALASVSLAACEPRYEWDGSLENLLRSTPEKFGAIMADPEKHRLQIIYTQIDRTVDDAVVFTSYRYRVDADEYFYPASTVKLPTALLALEKINRLGVSGLDRDTPMLTEATRPSQSEAVSDPTSPGGLPTIGQYVQKILLVSDNDAFNRLYEFLGQEYLNDTLHARGYTGTRIMHRLEIALKVEENRHTNPVRFVNGDTVLYAQPPVYSSREYLAAAPILLGEAELVGDQLLQRPKDFSEKNAFPLQDLHDVLVATIFPDSVPGQSRFDLTPDQFRFVYHNMSAYPGDASIAEYQDAARYPEGFVKFLMFGGSATSIPDNIRIFNKVGDAYGFLTDAAYIIDTEAGIEFILAATVYVNENRTFNDNQYEYDELGLPFLRDLGQALYDVELRRARAVQPDFGRVLGSEQGSEQPAHDQ